MLELTDISLTRYQLAKFLPNHESIKELERLFAQDSEIAQYINNIITAAGLEDDGTYAPDTLAKFIYAATSLKDADSLLDTAIFDETRAKIVPVNTTSQLSESNQSVLADASGGDIDLTMPNPANCYSSNRSFKIGITKVDSTTNTVNILPFGSETIAGAASEFLDVQMEVLNFITDGTNWYLEA